MAQKVNMHGLRTSAHNDKSADITEEPVAKPKGANDVAIEPTEKSVRYDAAEGDCPRAGAASI